MAAACRTAGTVVTQQADAATGCGADLGATVANYRGTDAAAATEVAGAMPRFVAGDGVTSVSVTAVWATQPG